MVISEMKRQMLYKNKSGGRIMVRISLPKAERVCEMNSFYETLGEKYLSSAVSFINSSDLCSTFFLDVSFEEEEKDREIKIKRLSTLREGGKTLKLKTFTDIINKSELSIKK